MATLRLSFTIECDEADLDPGHPDIPVTEEFYVHLCDEYPDVDRIEIERM